MRRARSRRSATGGYTVKRDEARTAAATSSATRLRLGRGGGGDREQRQAAKRRIAQLGAEFQLGPVEPAEILAGDGVQTA